MVHGILSFCYRMGIRLFGGIGFGKIIFLKWIHDILYRATRKTAPSEIKIFHHTLFLVPGDNMGLATWGEQYERHVIKLIERELSYGETFIDIGANIGFFTLIGARCVGPNGKVFAFEPDPQNAFFLRKNIIKNNYKNVVIEEKAVGEHPGSISLFLSRHNSGDHCIYDRQSAIKDLLYSHELNAASVYDQHSFNDPREEITVPVISLDEYFFGPIPVSLFFKIDVQGAEGIILKGAKRILKEVPRMKIVTEFWPAGMKMAGVDAGQVLNILSHAGFQFFEINKNGKLSNISPQELLHKYTPQNNKTGEVFCVK